MDEHASRSDEEGDYNRSLQTYLRDHIAGAQHAIQLFEALKTLHAGTSVGQFAADQLQQITEDLAILKNLAASAGADDFQLKEFAGWLGDKLSRLKLAPLGNAFNTFEALEFLSLGILGKRALWGALRSIAPQHPELNGVDFALLLDRAEAQYAATEKIRLAMAARAFG